MLKKLVLILVGAVVVIGAGVSAAFQLRPSVLLIRNAFAEGADEPKVQAARLVPPGITEQIGLRYGEADDAVLDVFVPPNTQGPLPAAIWVHGGGFIGGTRTDLTDIKRSLPPAAS